MCLFFDPQLSMCLCLQMVLNPTVIPRDAAHKACFNRPKYSKTEVQEDLKEEAKM